MMFPSIPDALPMLQSGQIRPIAVMADKRSPLLPDLPTTVKNWATPPSGAQCIRQPER